MTKQEVQTQVIDIVADVLGLDPTQVLPESDLHEDLDADSLDALDILMDFEAEFEMAIPDEKVDDLKTVGQWIEYIQDNYEEHED